MSYKNLPERFRGLDIKQVADSTGLTQKALKEIAGLVPNTEPRAADAGEAVALGKYFAIDPVKILHTQVSEELAAVGYKPAKKEPTPEPTRAGAKSPMIGQPVPRKPRGSVNW